MTTELIKEASRQLKHQWEQLNAMHGLLDEQRNHIINLERLLKIERELYAEIVPEFPTAWIDQQNVPTDRTIYHLAVLEFLQRNDTLFGLVLTPMHDEWIRKGDF